MKLWQYIQGSRKGKEAHEIEKEAMKDPFLADALAGYETSQDSNPQKKVAKLQKEINKRQKRATESTSGKKKSLLKIWGIAAGILLIAGGAAWYFLQEYEREDPQKEIIRKPEQQETVAVREEIKEPVQEKVKETIREDTINQAKPQPVTGMKEYQGYINRNLIRPTDEECRNVKGRVIVTFKVGQSGRPYNIRVTEGLCTSINKEAIRLVINGPDWRKGTETDEASLTIDF